MNQCKDVHSPTNWYTGLLKFLRKCQQDILNCRHNYSKIYLKGLDRIAKTILKKKEKNEVRRLSLHGIKIYCSQNLLQSCTNQNCVILAEREIHILMEESREARNTHIQICTTDFWQRYKSNSMEEWQLFPHMMLESLDIPRKIIIIIPQSKPHLLYKNNSKWILFGDKR